MSLMTSCSLSAVTLALLLAHAAPLAHAQPADLPPPLPAAAGEVSRSPVPSQPALPAPGSEDAAMAELPPARKTTPETRIDQRRVGNRVVEVTVTPAGSTRSYTVQNREGQRPLSVHELSSGLSVPTFFKLDF
jgi:hypothetical protein